MYRKMMYDLYRKENIDSRVPHTAYSYEEITCLLEVIQ